MDVEEVNSVRDLVGKICLNIKLLRLKKGYTQVFVAEELNFSIRSYQRLEAGDRTPGIDQLFTITQFYNVELEDLLQ